MLAPTYSLRLRIREFSPIMLEPFFRLMYRVYCLMQMLRQASQLASLMSTTLSKSFTEDASCNDWETYALNKRTRQISPKMRRNMIGAARPGNQQSRYIYHIIAGRHKYLYMYEKNVF